jgi:hypothetical protein
LFGLFLGLAAGLGAGLGLVAPIPADEPETVSVKLHYAGLDRSMPAGAAALH